LVVHKIVNAPCLGGIDSGVEVEIESQLLQFRSRGFAFLLRIETIQYPPIAHQGIVGVANGLGVCPIDPIVVVISTTVITEFLVRAPN
jgi:hypothetical protein